MLPPPPLWASLGLTQEQGGGKPAAVRASALLRVRIFQPYLEMAPVTSQIKAKGWNKPLSACRV